MFDPGRFLVQLVVIVAASRAVGWIAARFGQPRVVGEITAGILLGPSLLGFLAPRLSAWLFPSATFPVLLAVSHLGLLFFMALAWRGAVDKAVPGGTVSLAGWDLHPLTLLYALSGSLMISKTIHIPKP